MAPPAYGIASADQLALAAAVAPPPPGPRTAGGRRIAVGRHNDPAEDEADRIADRVLGMAAVGTPVRPMTHAPMLRRACAACAAEEELLHRKAADGSTGSGLAPPSVHAVLASHGDPLPARSRAFFEPRLGADLGGVRVHTGARAAASARDVGARAYTVGSDIVFARNAWAPGTPGGDRLLAHELAHVVQHGAPVLRRAPGDDDPLTGVSLTLIAHHPPTFRVTLAFKSGPASFEVSLSARADTGLAAGTTRLAASAIGHPDDVPAGSVLFTLPDYSGAYIWFNATPANTADLMRAGNWMKAHGPVTLTITDGTQTAGDAKGDKDAKSDGGPKALPPDPWLAKEMMPAVLFALSANYSAIKLGKLIPYISPGVQAREGTDIALIQVNRPDSKAIAGHVHVDRRKWADQPPAAQTAYAGEIAAAIVRKLAEAAKAERAKELDASLAKSATGETFPAWAIALKTAVDKKLAAIRTGVAAGTKSPADLPDRIHLAALGKLTCFELILEREASNAPGQMLWQRALMTPALDETQANDIDALVTRVREQTALLRARKVAKLEKSDTPQLTDMLMPAIPAQITSGDINTNGTTSIDATNHFYMSVRFDMMFSQVGGRDTLNMVSYAKRLGTAEIDYVWKVVRLTADNAATYVRTPPPAPKGAPGAKASDLFFDLSNRAIDQRSKTTIAMQQVRLDAVADDSAVAVADTNHGAFEYKFPADPGIYLVIASVTPRPLTSDTLRQVFPPSRAVFPVRVQTAKDMANETQSESKDAIAAKQNALADPTLTARQRMLIDADLAKLRTQQTLSPLDMTRSIEGDFDTRIATFTALKNWLVADRARHPTTVGTATEDPLLVRLIMQDRVHETHLYEPFQELLVTYGDSAYDIAHLADPVDSETGQFHVLNRHLRLLGAQKAETAKLATRIASDEADFLPKTTRQTMATLVVAKTGKAMPLLLLVGEDKTSKPGAIVYRIQDLTLSGTGLYKKNDQIFLGAPAKAADAALDNAFTQYGRDNKYDNGQLFWRFGTEDSGDVPNVTTPLERAEDIAMVMAVVGMVATVVATGGAATPFAAGVIAAITVANAALAIALSTAHLAHRHDLGTLEFDAAAALDVVNIIASIVGLGSLARGRQLATVAREAKAANDMARAAAALGKLETLGRTMLLFDTAVLGATAVITTVKVAQDISAVKKLHLPPAEEEAAMKQIASDAIVQGAMMAFQSVMLARSHLEMYRGRIEEGRYKSMEERGWVDADGKITEHAPPSLRAAAEGKPPVNGEHPPVALESDLPRVVAAGEAGEARLLRNDPEHDVEIPFRDEKGEAHSFKRRREDGRWCRYSDNPFCYINQEQLDEIDRDIAKILERIGAFDEPRKSGTGANEPATVPAAVPKAAPKGVPGKRWGAIGGEAATLTKTIEATIDAATISLRKTLGKQWLPAHIYGTKLHKVAADLFRSMKLPRGWTAIVDKPLRMSTKLDPKVAKMTVREFLTENAPWLLPEPNRGPNVDPAKAAGYSGGVSESLLGKHVGDIEPDLVLIAPDGTTVIWDLAPGMTPEHFAKTIVYAHAIDSTGGRVQIGETYYRPQAAMDLNPTAQARFRGPAATAEGARVTLKDDAALSLAKQWVGKGKPVPMDPPRDPAARAQFDALVKAGKIAGPATLEPGFSGAVERAVADKVVGQYFDAKTNAWVDTKAFTIHYTADGMYVRPEAP